MSLDEPLGGLGGAKQAGARVEESLCEGEYLIAIPLYANRARLDEGDELFVGVTHLLHRAEPVTLWVCIP